MSTTYTVTHIYILYNIICMREGRGYQHAPAEATYFNIFVLLFTVGILPDWTATRRTRAHIENHSYISPYSML